MSATPNISASYTSPTRTVRAKAIRHHISDTAVMCFQSFTLCIWRTHMKGCGWVKYIDVENLMKFPMPFKFDPSPACRCRSKLAACAASTRACIQSNLHLPSSAILGGFIPLCLLFLFKPFFLCCVKHILFLVNYLSLSTSSVPLCGLAASAWIQVVFHCRKMYTSHDWWLLFSHSFTLVFQPHMSKLRRT